MAYVAIDAIWLRALLKELGYTGKDSKQVLLYGDNQGSLALAENPELYQRIKHIAVKYHFIRQQVRRKKIDLWFIGTNHMKADGLTKALGPAKHAKFVKQLNLQLLKV